jgi:hypothetical protein
MLRLRKTPRAEFFTSRSAAWWCASALFVLAVFAGYRANQVFGAVGAVCPTRLLASLPCPLCGGTRAAMGLLRGEVEPAFRLNPLASLLVSTGALWTVLWLGLGRRLETTLKAPVVTALLLCALALNWAYVLAHRP